MAKNEKWTIDEVNGLLKSVSTYGKVDGTKKFADSSDKRTYESARKKLHRIDVDDFDDEIDVEELSWWGNFKLWFGQTFFPSNVEIIDEDEQA